MRGHWDTIWARKRRGLDGRGKTPSYGRVLLPFKNHDERLSILARELRERLRVQLTPYLPTYLPAEPHVGHGPWATARLDDVQATLGTSAASAASAAWSMGHAAWR
jgi:hypothetical protein